MDHSSKRLAILLVLGLFTASMTVTYFIENVEASSLSIIDYDYEGIVADSTQYFVLWNRGSQLVDLTVNASALEFVGAIGWPQLELRVFEFQDYNYIEGYLAICWSLDNYTCRLSYQAENDSRYVLAVSNLDSV